MDAGEIELVRMMIREALYGAPDGQSSLRELMTEIRTTREDMQNMLQSIQSTADATSTLAVAAVTAEAEITEALENVENEAVVEAVESAVDEGIDEVQTTIEESTSTEEVPIIDDNGQQHMVEVEEHPDIEPDRVHPLERNIFGRRNG